jgi:hypothetical protein
MRFVKGFFLGRLVALLLLALLPLWWFVFATKSAPVERACYNPVPGSSQISTYAPEGTCQTYQSPADGPTPQAPTPQPGTPPGLPDQPAYTPPSSVPPPTLPPDQLAIQAANKAQAAQAKAAAKAAKAAAKAKK